MSNLIIHASAYDLLGAGRVDSGLIVGPEARRIGAEIRPAFALKMPE